MELEPATPQERQSSHHLRSGERSRPSESPSPPRHTHKRQLQNDVDACSSHDITLELVRREHAQELRVQVAAAYVRGVERVIDRIRKQASKVFVARVFRGWIQAVADDVAWRQRQRDLAGFHRQMHAQKTDMHALNKALRRWSSLVAHNHAKRQQLAWVSPDEHDASIAALRSTYEQKLALLRERQTLSDQIALHSTQAPEDTETAYAAAVAAVEHFAEALRTREGQDDLRRLRIERRCAAGTAYTTWEAEVGEQWAVPLVELRPEDSGFDGRRQWEAVTRLRTKLTQEHAEAQQRLRAQLKREHAQELSVADKFAVARLKGIEEHHALKLGENEQACQNRIAQKERELQADHKEHVQRLFEEHKHELEELRHKLCNAEKRVEELSVQQVEAAQQAVDAL